MVTDIHWTYGGDHLAVYTSIESLHFTSETNTMLCQLYLNFRKKEFVFCIVVTALDLKGQKLYVLEPLLGAVAVPTLRSAHCTKCKLG